MSGSAGGPMGHGGPPLASVVVPTRDRPAQLAECLAHLARVQAPPGGFEVIVVDDGGSADLGPALEGVRGALDVQLVAQAHGGPARARNTGAAHARGTYLAFLDDDCRPTPGWLRALVGAAEQGLAGGCVVNALPAACPAASQALCDYLYAYYEAAGGPRFFTSNNIALRRDLYLRHGGFDEAFTLAAGEDRALCDRLAAQGVALLYVPDAVVAHAHRLGLAGYLRQHFRYGRGAFRFHRSRGARGAGARQLEPLGFYTGLVRAPFAAGEPRERALLLSVLLAVSQGAHAAGYVWEGVRLALARARRRLA